MNGLELYEASNRVLSFTRITMDTIDKNDAPEGMIAVKPVEIVSCYG